VDIQPIAVQIAKLRFFISLVIDQKTDRNASNMGVRSLPNLETKFVAANTLIGLEKEKESAVFRTQKIVKKEDELKRVRHEYFTASSRDKKNRLQMKDKKLRNELADELKALGIAEKSADNIASFDPYDQNTHAEWFDAEWMFGVSEGFDIVIGNPPYVQLQKNSGELSKLYGPKKEGKKTIPSPYQTFDSMGDIYSLFYERGYQLLKPKGTLCFITSNKWMRAGYGENTRKFFADNTNPKLLIDFAGVKVFESATVDTNILMFAKDKNRQQTQACIVKKEGIKDLSVFVRQNTSVCNFGTESWIVLSPIEQRIKRKIEAVGTPLKDWDINIYRGVLTGFNDAFIISGEKRKELIKQDPKSEEIIRPILRGRDIKRYGYEFADLYLITTFPSLKIDIEVFPAVKQHLLSFGYDRLKQTGEPGARKRTGNKWFETQDSISYWEDFYKQKIVYPNMTKFLPFYYDNKGFFQNDKSFMITGNNIAFLTAFLNSSLFKFCFIDDFPELQGGTRELRKIFFDKIPVMEVDNKINALFEIKITEIQTLKQQNIDTKQCEIEIDNMIFDLYKLSEEERKIIGFIEIQ
jgi:hypothetical protein